MKPGLRRSRSEAHPPTARESGAQVGIGHPGAAASLREELEETVTPMGLHLSEGLERVLSSTNLLENLFSRVPAHIEKIPSSI
jgi:hypothetical protein